MKKVFLFIFLIFLFFTLTFSDVLVFKNGKKIKVKKLRLKDDVVYYELDGVAVSINKRYVNWEESLKETKKEKKFVKMEDKGNGFLILRKRKEKYYKFLENDGIEVKEKTFPPPGPIKASDYEDISLVKLSKMNKISLKEARDLNKRLSGLLKKYIYDKKYNTSSFLESGIGVIPFFRNYQNMICVNAVVNDRANVEFVFDTGATYTMFCFKSAEVAGVKVLRDRYVPVQTASGIARFRFGYVEKMEIGNMKIKDLGVLVAPPGLTDVNLLGQNVIKGFKVTIDEGERKIFLKK